MIGIELVEPQEDCNDGSLEGARYFTCPQGCGHFLRPTSVFRAVSKQQSILEMPEHVSDEEEDDVPPESDAPALTEAPTHSQGQYRLDAERRGSHALLLSHTRFSGSRQDK